MLFVTKIRLLKVLFFFIQSIAAGSLLVCLVAIYTAEKDDLRLHITLPSLALGILMALASAKLEGYCKRLISIPAPK